MKQTPFLVLGGMLLSGACGTAAAQSSLTVYGIADAALTHLDHRAGGATTYMRGGPKDGNRIGFKGAEDLGNGLKALFVLEAGYNIDDGSMAQTGSLFNRAAYVGLSDARLGTLTVGHQYAPYFDFLTPLGPLPVVTGAAGDHPGDIDGFDVTIRNNNAVKYTSPNWHGLTVGLLAASGEQPDRAGDSGSGDAFSAGAKYDSGAWHYALGWQVLRNGPERSSWDASSAASFSKSPVNAGYLSASEVRYVAAGMRYQSGQLSLGGTLSNVQYHADGASLFRDTAIFNTASLLAGWQTASPWSLGAGVTHTRASRANGIDDAASYLQFSLMQGYWLSRRTVVYLLEATQRAHGRTLAVGAAGQIEAGAAIGVSQSGLVADSRRQSMLTLGLRHAF
jgi:predicted porin